MAVTRDYSFGFDTFTQIDDAERDIAIVATSDGFAVASTNGSLSDIDYYNGDGVQRFPFVQTATGIDPSIARFSSGNTVTVAEQGGNIFYEINGTDGFAVRSGDLATANSSDADVAVLRSGLSFTDNRFVTTSTRQFGSETDIRVDIRNASGVAVTSFAVDASTTASDTNSRVVALAGSFSTGPGGIQNTTGGFVVMFDRFVPQGGGGIGGTSSLMYAVYNADGSVRKAPTTVLTGSAITADITAVGDGFAMTWIDTNGDLKLRQLDEDGNSIVGGGTQTIYDTPAGVRIFSPTITTLSNGYFGIAVQTVTGGTLESPGTPGKMLLMVQKGFVGFSTLFAEDYILGGDLRFMDAEGFGTGKMVIGGQQGNFASAGLFVVDGRRSSTGDGANDTITGDDLIDNMSGGGGNDTLSGAGNSDGLSGGDGNDTLDGGADNDFLDGGAGTDVLTGGTGADTMRGGADNDSYEVDNLGDIVDESVAGSSGVDVVRSSTISIDLTDTARFKGGIEQIALTGSANLNATGNALANVINGNAGNNVIDGRSGADFMRGFAGNDRYVVDNAGDVVDESLAGSGGTDTVTSANLSINLSDTIHFKGAIEQIVLTGAAALSATGNALNNAIVGNAGGNLIDGRAGSDIMRGMAGDDRYVVDNAGDIVDEDFAGSSGLDTVRATISVNLTDAVHFRGAIEQVVLDGGGAISAVGNALANAILGNAAANSITGGLGIDRMGGGGGGDSFVFRNALDSGVGVNRDVILDFEDVGDNDTIDLSGFAGTLAFIGGGGFTAASQIRAIQSGADVLVQINTGGTLAADSEILLQNTALAQIDAADFVV